jgi:galactosamine-6-phosphate isomerase
MELNIQPDYESLSLYTARSIIKTIVAKPDALFCLPTGDSPRRCYELLTGMINREKVDISRCRFIGLDEWVGIPPQNPGSCHFFLKTLLFDPLRLSSSQFHLFNSLSADLDSECKKMDSFIRSQGGIDLMLVGLGMNGHIGFNEPGVSFQHYSHVIELDETTRSVGQKYFKQETMLSRGITLGLQHLAESRSVIMIANGSKKAPVIKKMLEEEVNNQLPATVMRTHNRAELIIDEEAAALITQKDKYENL